jgi:hypothetical protein
MTQQGGERRQEHEKFLEIRRKGRAVDKEILATLHI